MPYVLIQHTVAKYKSFEPVYKDDSERRKRLGSRASRLFRDVEDDTRLFALFEWDSLENAQKFANSSELREAREWATDSVPAKVFILEEVLSGDA